MDGETKPPGSIGYLPDRTASDADALLLREFKPQSRLHAAVHEVERARFPVIDVHQHVNDPMGVGDRLPLARVVEIMDACNVRQVVILTGGWGRHLEEALEMVAPHPGRFRVFTQIDWSGVEAPGFAERRARQLREAVARGASGLKVLKDLGLGVRDEAGKLLAIDDSRLDPVWAECAELEIPVTLHTADPQAFFDPADATNERYEELVRHPDWRFHGPALPSHQALLEARDRLFARHPRTRFVAAHVGGWAENLDAVSAMLQRFPNVSVDTAGRQAELGRQPRRARRFFLDHADRILFGSDTDVALGMYRSHFRWLETEDEHFDYWNATTQGRWRIYGLGLPAEVLEKVYLRNAERLFSGSGTAIA